MNSAEICREEINIVEGKDTEKVQKRIKNDPKFATYNPRRRGHKSTTAALDLDATSLRPTQNTSNDKHSNTLGRKSPKKSLMLQTQTSVIVHNDEPLAYFDEEKRKKSLLEATENILELVKTEKNYVRDLKKVVQFIEYFKNSKKKVEGHAEMPQGLSSGRDKIAFGNIESILEFHENNMMKPLEEAEQNWKQKRDDQIHVTPEDLQVLVNLFQGQGKKMKEKYGTYSINTPLSNLIVANFKEYFNTVRIQLDMNEPIESLLMTPIQRVTRYHLLLKEAKRNFQKAGCHKCVSIVQKAYDLAEEISKYSNNMMNAGRIQGMENSVIGNINKQGLLEQFDRVMCYKRRRIGRRIRPKDCMIFVFSRSIIIAEEGELVRDAPQLEYWCGFPMIPTRLKIREGGRNNNGYWFELERTEAKPGQDAGKDEENSVIVECKTEAKRDDLLKQIKDLSSKLEFKGDFL